jgi:hypothetical protein
MRATAPEFRRLGGVLALTSFIAVVAGCGVTYSVYHPQRGTRIIDYTLHSHDVHGDLHEVRVVPPQHGDWTLVLLHGYDGGPSEFFSRQFFRTLASLGRRAPEVLLLDGGVESYWHDRASGKWGSMVLHEAIPPHGRVAIGGLSMGGYGALLAASRDRRFCATAVMSPAIGTDIGRTQPNAFDNSEDFARNDVFTLRSPHPLWIAVGSSDTLYPTDALYARRAGITAHVSPGGHDLAFFDSHIGALIRFAAHACA